jgi:transcription elongation factor Elf1
MHEQPEARSETMVVFKCPFCRTEYEMTTARLSFQQRSYAKCQVCHQTMYSWNSRNVPMFTLINASEDERSPLLG